jgi:hypothetical protein
MFREILELGGAFQIYYNVLDGKGKTLHQYPVASKDCGTAP